MNEQLPIAENDAAALDQIERAFKATFEPDFGGFDWRDDAAIQRFARTVGMVLHRRTRQAPAAPIRLGSCCVNVGTDACVCENPTNWGSPLPPAVPTRPTDGDEAREVGG
jgi:hypothetical protein